MSVPFNQLSTTGEVVVPSDLTGFANHVSNTSNPHSVTKAQVGLGNVDNVNQNAGIFLFDITRQYYSGNFCIYSGALYKFTTSHRGNWTASHATKIADLTTGAPASGDTKLITNGQVYTALEDKADKSDVTPLQLAAWYPDGSVTSVSQFTSGLNYDYDSASHTAAVCPFATDGEIAKHNADKTGAIIIPPYVDYDGERYEVTSIAGISDPADEPSGASITSVVAPTTVKQIGGNAFYFCGALSSVSFPGVTSVGSDAFDMCGVLTSISLPAATTMASWALSYICEVDTIPEVEFPSLESVGDRLFCASYFTSISLPAAVELGTGAFDDCDRLEILDFGGTARSSIPSIVATDFDGVPTTCKIIVPDGNYTAWTTASGWSDLVAAGYTFLRHSEWEYARKCEMPDVSGKLDQDSAAPEFSVSTAYVSGEHVTYNGRLYRFTADHAAGAWTGNDVVEDNMTTPDATLDLTSGGGLRLVAADGTVLWTDGLSSVKTAMADSGVTLSEYPTQNEMAAALKKIWEFMGGQFVSIVTFLLVSLAALGAVAAPVTPSTQWGDVVPTNTLADVAKGAQLVSSNDLETALSNVIVKYPNGAVDLGFRKPGSTVGDWSVVEGTNCVASTSRSHAEGWGTTAGGTNANASNAHAEGSATIATNANAHAEGQECVAGGWVSHAEGYRSKAFGMNGSHAEGRETKADGSGSHSEGYNTEADGSGAHSEGGSTLAKGKNTHAAGSCARATNNVAWCWQGVDNYSYYGSHGDGSFNINPVNGLAGFWIGQTNLLQHLNNITFTKGVNNSFNHADFASADGAYSHSEGFGTTAQGNYSHAEGTFTVASGDSSHSEGFVTTAAGRGSHADGYSAVTAASGGAFDPVGPHDHAYAWQGYNGTNSVGYYHSHGNGTYNINPVNGARGFYIGETNFVDHVANIATNLVVPASLPVKRIAMFIIEVNPWVMERITFTNNANVVYTGFELKASTNNFDKASPLDVKLQFWSQSHSADTGVLGSDKMKIYMPVGNDPSYDMRSYKKIQNTLGMHKGELARMVVLVDTSCLVRHAEDGGKWLSESNEDLMWVYMRDTAGGTETYPGTSTQWWHPIAPVRWFSKMPNWAQ